ncbi:MAG: DNA polymerase I [Parcubacteria bacterium C7867-008]|nr:MAG: DNA polymerase I [Parcubacteria bacterium C7867-008]
MPKAPTKKVEKKKRLVLLDAHAIIHRAYHALPDFTSPTGEPTGALYGLSSMLLRIIQDLKPDYLASCYDLPKATFRHEAYDAYKGTRVSLDDALAKQLNTSRKVFEAFSIPIYEKEGFEADDMLGTICELTRDQKDLEIIIASGDMDTLQLIEKGRVKVYTLKKGINDTIIYDEKSVEERYGFAPKMVADYKGLRGDPSDNIIGIPGVGEKTATELIQKFGTIEDIYKKLKKNEALFTEQGIKPRIVALLKEYEEDALFSKMLTTIRIDAPIVFRLPEAVWQDGSVLPKVLALFDELGFRTLRGRARALFEKGDGSVEETDPEVLVEEKDIDPTRLQEAQVMVWLLASDLTNPTLDDILAYTKAQTFDAAYKTLQTKIDTTGQLDEVYQNIEKPLVPVLRAMEAHGVLIDQEALGTLGKTYRKELEAVEKRIFKVVGHEFNISSPKQLGDVLFDELQLKAPGSKAQKKTSTGQRSTKESELEKLREHHPIIEDILEYRQIQKLLGTYIDNIPPLLDAEGRIHPQFIQTGAVTGRMATTNPSIQNIPIRTERGRAIRHAFIAPKGFELIGLDYSQIELRLAAILSGDEKLGDIFRSGRDVHREVAAAVFGVIPENVDPEMRRRAKIINFGILYGMGVNALKAQLGTSTSEAQQFYEDYFRTFNRLAEYLEETRGAARRQGFTETLFGRRREFSGIKSSLPFVRAQAERMAINAPIQGTQADIIKIAMVRIQQMLTDENALEDAHMLLQVHDELVFEIRESRSRELAQKIREIMETVVPEDQTLGIPLLAQPKIGKNWGDMQALD